MHLLKVEIKDFRNLISTSFKPSPSLNLIYGDNGSGKSSLLEAIYYLSTGSSFRTHKISNLVQNTKDCFTLFSELESGNVTHRMGIQRCLNTSGISRLDGRALSRRSELVELLPLQIISPESVSLLLEGSDQRRNYLDWILFHVEHSYHHHLSHYHRALRQRNAVLREGAINNLNIWDTQLIEHGEPIQRLRVQILDSLWPRIESFIASLLPGVEIEMKYRQGWSAAYSLAEALSQSYESDIRLKYTTVGPHRADVLLSHGGSKASESLSRGQLKLVVIAFKLAQIAYLQASTNKKPIILIDDLAAELDIEHRTILLKTLLDFDSQLFVTTPDLSLIDSDQWYRKRVFHVEHGGVKEVV